MSVEYDKNKNDSHNDEESNSKNIKLIKLRIVIMMPNFFFNGVYVIKFTL